MKFLPFIKRKESYSNADRLFVDNKMRDGSLLSSSSVSVTSNGYPENLVSRSSGSERPLEHSFLLPNEFPGSTVEDSWMMQLMRISVLLLTRERVA